MVKKRVIVYLILFSLIVGVYTVDSMFFGSVTTLSVKEISNGELKDIEVKSAEIENSVEKVERGNEITGSVIQTNDVSLNSLAEEEEKEEEVQSSSTTAKVEVSVEVVG